MSTKERDWYMRMLDWILKTVQKLCLKLLKRLNLLREGHNQSKRDHVVAAEHAIVASFNASDQASMSFLMPLQSAKQLMHDPNEFAQYDRATLKQLSKQFRKLVKELDRIIDAHQRTPTDLDATSFCQQSRKTFYVVAAVFDRRPKKAWKMARRLLDRYDQAESLLEQCGCAVCSHNLEAVRRRHTYLAAVVRHGPSYVTPCHMLRLAGEA